MCVYTYVCTCMYVCLYVFVNVTPTCSLEYSCEVWNANECQAKALESIQLLACQFILACCVTTCVEPVCADSGLKTLKNWRDFCKLYV